MGETRFIDWCDFLDCPLGAVYDGDCPFEDRFCMGCSYNIDKEIVDG